MATEDRQSEAAQHLEQAAKLSVRSGQLDRAAELLETCLSLHSNSGGNVTGNPYGRLVLAFVLVQERRGDCVAASKVRGGRGGEGRLTIPVTPGLVPVGRLLRRSPVSRGPGPHHGLQ